MPRRTPKPVGISEASDEPASVLERGAPVPPCYTRRHKCLRIFRARCPQRALRSVLPVIEKDGEG
jgi:hypothetical protein